MRGNDTQTSLTYLESLYPEIKQSGEFRFPVQNTSKTDSGELVISGTLAGGEIAVGDDIMVAASLKRSRIAQITSDVANLSTASSGDKVAFTLADDINISKGDVLHKPGEPLERSNQFQAHLIWMTEDPMLPERSYLMEIGPQTTSVQITDLKYAIKIETAEHLPATKIEINEIA
ncbi:MAG: adenylyl-sulfate kinase, partial [Xanthomonadales bacterium]|nr:adenylyl-sulfate kinase [Xanthomonadales bacterium]